MKREKPVCEEVAGIPTKQMLSVFTYVPCIWHIAFIAIYNALYILLITEYPGFIYGLVKMLLI
jgi:hypothetical protein